MFNYTYSSAAAWIATATAWNSHSSSSVNCTAYVELPITDFQITYPLSLQYYAYNTPIVIQFSATNGTGISVAISSNNGSNFKVYWDRNTLTGNTTITASQLFIPVGLKTVFITASNRVPPKTVTVSYSFQVEYLFANFSYSPNPAYIDSTKLQPFSILWDTASHFNCAIDYGEISPKTASYPNALTVIDSNNQIPISIGTPPYTDEGIYTITVNVSNDVDWANYTITVIVQNPVCCVGLETNWVGTLQKSAGAQAQASFSLIWLNNTRPFPTSAIYDYDFGENAFNKLDNQTYLSQINQTTLTNYSTSNTFTVTVTVHNLISSKTLTTIVYMVVGFSNVIFDMKKYDPLSGYEIHNYCLKTNEIAEFYMSMGQGTFFNMTIDFADGSPAYTTFSVNDTMLAHNYSFSLAGNYSVSMVIQNRAQNLQQYLPLAAPQQVIVEDAIQCFQFNIPQPYVVIAFKNKAAGATIELDITTNCTFSGTNPRYTIDWGDTVENSTKVINPTKTVPHTYYRSNIYNIKVIIWNEVSSQLWTSSIQVFDEVAQVTILPYSINSSQNNIQVEGYKANDPKYASATLAYFDINYVVMFYATKLFGTYEDYAWSMNDSWTPEFNNQTITRRFTDVGAYLTSLTIKNQPSAQSATYTVIVERSLVNANLSDNTPYPYNVSSYQHFVVSMDVVGTNACYFFDMDENSTTNSDCRYRLFGNEWTCREFFPDYFSPPTRTRDVCATFQAVSSSDIEAFQFNGSQTGKAYLNFTHRFAVPRGHDVNFTVINHVSNFSMLYRTVVTKGWCQFPIVTVQSLNRCQRSDTCKCFANQDFTCNSDADIASGNRVVYKKDQILVDADVTINCTSSPNIWFRWTVLSLDLSTPPKVIANVTKTLNGLDYQSFTSKVLVVPPGYIQPGRYNFTLTVSRLNCYLLL